MLLPAAIIRYAIIIWAIVCVTFTGVRIALTLLAETPATTDSARDLMLAFAVGALRDAALAALLVAPGLVLLTLFRRLWQGGMGRVFAALAGMAFLGFVLFGAVAEVFFWNEFDSRFNGVAVNYLMFPREVIGNIRESFDVGTWLPMIAAATLLVALLLRKELRACLDASGSARRHSGGVAMIMVVAASAALLAILPARVSANREINEIAENGLETLATAALTNDIAYDGIYPGMPEAEAIEIVREFYSDDRLLDPPGTPSIRRYVDNGDTPKRLNVVIVIEESFGSVFVDSLDNYRDESLSPNLDRLARDGLFFTNIYASGDRSVRGLEAVLTSFQPIPGISTARRPGSQGMVSLPRVLRRAGYETAMLYAGIDSFDNMGSFWRGIGFDHVWDERDIEEAGFSTVWGDADEYLLAEALRRLDRMTTTGKPAMLSMFTVSNHRPYEYPTGRIDKDPVAHRIENTATYADWAFGNFIAQARSHPRFDDTVFVFVADHGWKVNGAAQVPLHSFRIPLLFYAPKHIAPARIDRLGAQIDLAPTLLGLLGISYESRFFGKDLMQLAPRNERIAVAHNYSIAFARPGSAVVLEPDGSLKSYAFTPGKAALAPTETPDPVTARLGTALTQMAHHMFYGGAMADDLDERLTGTPRPTPGTAVLED